MLAFEGRGKLEHPNKNLSEQEGENQQQIQPTYMYDTTSRTCTWAILVGRELSHTPPHYLSSLFLIIILQATRGACSLFLVSGTLLLYREVFPESVHILRMLMLYRLICMVCGCEGCGVKFKVHLMSR